MFDFLILGAGRSGTSLLAALLDRHSELEVAFELGGNAYLRGKALDEHADNLLDQRAGAFINACLDAAAQSSSPSWGNKITTEQLSGLNRHNLTAGEPVDTVERFFSDYFKGRKVIYLLRDGRACIASKLRRTRQPLELACQHWLRAVDILEHLRESDTPLLELRYEEMVVNPAQTLRASHAFLGISYQAPDMSAASHPGMPEAYRRPGIDATRASEVAADHPCMAYIRDAMLRCGYI